MLKKDKLEISELMPELQEENDLVSDNFIKEAGIENGTYDNISECKFRIPTHWEIARVYKRLIIMVDSDKENYILIYYVIKTLIQVLSSWIIEKIDNYNSSMYYENPEYIYECYIQGKVL